MKLKRIDALALIVILEIIGVILILTEIIWSRSYVDSPVNIGGPPTWMLLMGFTGIGLMTLGIIIATSYLEDKPKTK